MLDDPLSAVDWQVGLNIVSDCLLGMLKNKTIILATHQIGVGKHADRVILLDKGMINFDGPYTDFNQQSFSIE